jgi:hypothetical protein
MNITDIPSKLTSSTRTELCDPLSINFEFKLENQKTCDENHSTSIKRTTECGMDVLNHLEDLYLRMINNGYVFNLMFDNTNSGSAIIKFSKALTRKVENFNSDIERIAADYTTYGFYSGVKQFRFSDNIFSDEYSFTIVFKSFSKIAQWPNGENLVCALRDLLMKVSHHDA